MVSANLIPYTKFIGKPNVDYNKKILVFGSYEMVFIGTKNTTKRGRVTGITLR